MAAAANAPIKCRIRLSLMVYTSFGTGARAGRFLDFQLLVGLDGSRDDLPFPGRPGHLDPVHGIRTPQSEVQGQPAL